MVRWGSPLYPALFNSNNFATSAALAAVCALLNAILVTYVASLLHCAPAAAQCIVIGLSVGLFVCLWVCYHDNSKLLASIFTKLGL